MEQGLAQLGYAIIEQGMVSSLVSAKPEELRTHIEEATGVQNIEKKKETESRIKKTRKTYLESMTSG